MEEDMKKLTIIFLVISLFNYLACTTLNVATRESIEEDIKQGTLQSELYVITKDNNRYHFGEWGYQVVDDTLIGKGLKINLNGEEPFEGKIAMVDISHFEVKETDTMATVGLVLGIAAAAVLVFGLLFLAAVEDIFEPES
jgi:hypothetical protein